MDEEKHYAHLVPQDDAIGMLTTPSADNANLGQMEIQGLLAKVDRYERALKELVPAGQLEAYWARLKEP